MFHYTTFSNAAFLSNGSRLKYPAVKTCSVDNWLCIVTEIFCQRHEIVQFISYSQTVNISIIKSGSPFLP